MKAGCNILMYSHDTYGLGHIRRTMAIATHLAGPDTNVLILTGSPLVGRFSVPDQIDFVRIPGMIKMTNEEYLPLSIKINPKHALDIRKNIIKATAKTFQPKLFIVDKEPLGLKKEVLPTLKWLKRSLPGAKAILGLRDIMDDAATTRSDWDNKGVYQAMEELYSEVWVYGLQDFYDPVREYGIPQSIAKKMTFTGYIPRRIPDKKSVRKIKTKNGLCAEDKLVVVTAGGGGDGYVVMDNFLQLLEGENHELPFKTVFITGPFMPKEQRDHITDRARRIGVRAWHFYRRMEEILAAADVVVSMGGYNTVCEILSQGTVGLIIPRDNPRKEQLIRAKLLKERKMADYLEWRELTPEKLKRKVLALLEKPEPYLDAMSNFELTGLSVMSQRIEAFRNREP
jgi:predicted glycosyltransferase